LLVGESQVSSPHGGREAGPVVYVLGTGFLIGANVEAEVRVRGDIGNVAIGLIAGRAGVYRSDLPRRDGDVRSITTAAIDPSGFRRPGTAGALGGQIGAANGCYVSGDFIQHNYHWRDVLTHVKGAHTLKFGYEGWYGDDVEPFQGPWSQPKFSFNNLLTLAQDSPAVENGIYYNPATGIEQLWSWDAASRTFGLFAEDTWKAKKNLTVTLGLRYDDSGNPWSKSASTVFGNFYLGSGTTEQQQVASGSAKATHNALLQSVDNLFSPRIGIAWDPTGKGEWVVRGGFGIYNNWLTQANVQEEFRGSPPGEVAPTFFAGGTASAQAPIFVLGNSNKPPFGFTYPTFGPGTGPTPQSGGGLDAQGGIVGAGFAIGAINPHR